MARKESTIRSPGSQRTPKGFTQGNILVDPNTGDPICVKEDSEGKLRLCTDTLISIDASGINVDLDYVDDGVHIGDPSSGNILAIESDGSINVNTALDAKSGDNVALSAHPSANQIFDEDTGSVSTATYTQIYSFTSTSDNTRILLIECTMATQGVFRLKIDGTIKKIKRSSPLERNIEFKFDEHRPLLNGQSLTVEAKVEKYISTKSPYETFTSLEGYLCS